MGIGTEHVTDAVGLSLSVLYCDMMVEAVEMLFRVMGQVTSK